MTIQKTKGTKDYFGKESVKFFTTKNILSTLVTQFGYEQIVFPTLEPVELFKRSLGEDTDIVKKEMFTLQDRKDKTFVLRPEGTASTARLVLENKLTELEQQQKLFYIQNMFRYERPQKGRQREFYQLGIENLNANSTNDDLEVISIGERVLKSLEITKYKLVINSIGSVETRNKYQEELKTYFSNYKDELSSDSLTRLEDNVLRILDSKDEADIKVAANAPSIIDYLSTEEKETFEKIQQGLKELDIKFELNDKLVRGLDYYNDLVFEFISTDEEKLGSKATLIAGGRYDTLLTQIDSSKNVPAVGFASGIERLMLASSDKLDKIETEIDYTVITVSPEYDLTALKVANTLRTKYIVDVNYSTQALGKKISKAEKNNSTNIVIVGEEVKQDKVIVKNLKTSDQKEIEINKLGEI